MAFKTCPIEAVTIPVNPPIHTMEDFTNWQEQMEGVVRDIWDTKHKVNPLLLMLIEQGSKLIMVDLAPLFDGTKEKKRVVNSIVEKVDRRYHLDATLQVQEVWLSDQESPAGKEDAPSVPLASEEAVMLLWETRARCWQRILMIDRSTDPASLDDGETFNQVIGLFAGRLLSQHDTMH